MSLLVDYVENLQDGLVQAEALTKPGELGEAVWAYLEVLEVDPDNATARRQVGKVATAVRQFDNAAPGRRWLKKLQRQTRFRRWAAGWTARTTATWADVRVSGSSPSSAPWCWASSSARTCTAARRRDSRHAAGERETSTNRQNRRGCNSRSEKSSIFELTVAASRPIILFALLSVVCGRA